MRLNANEQKNLNKNIKKPGFPSFSTQNKIIRYSNYYIIESLFCRLCNILLTSIIFIPDL